MATTQYPAQNGDTTTTIQATYNYAEPGPPVIETYDDQCCGCFDIRSGIIILGVWLLVQSIFSVVIFVWYATDYYDETGFHIAIAALVFDVVFNLIGAALGIYGAYKYSKKGIYLFYIWAITRCLFAAFDVLFSFLYLLILGLWIYWTMVIRRYYKILTQQQLTGNNNGYTRYDNVHQNENDQFDANNPYAVTNEGRGHV